MAISTLGNNVWVFGAVSDAVDYKVKVKGIYVAAGAASGVVEFQTDSTTIFKATVNANESVTEHHVGWVDNLTLVSMPAGAAVTVQIE